MVGGKTKRGSCTRLHCGCKKRIAAHVKLAPRRVPAFRASNNRHIPRYKLVHEGSKDKYVANDYTFDYPKPEHLKRHDERWASPPEIESKGMERRNI